MSERLALVRVGLLEGFTLEGIVQIRMLPAEAGDEAGGEIERNEKRSPAFVLGNVDAFVPATSIEALLIAAPNDVTERHCRTGPDPRQPAFQKLGNDSTMGFDYTVNNPRRAAL